MSTKKRIGKYVVNMNLNLGKGAFSEVFEGIEEGTEQKVAVKIVSKSKIEEDEYTKNAFYSQIQIMKRLKSKNIIQFYDVHETKNNFYIVLELAQSGNLRSLLKKTGRLDEKTALRYLVQILNGFGELVKNGVIHRDLKPENILLKDDILKIGDFGFAKHSENNSFMKTIVGTPAYMAPQILAEVRYTYKCDIWALGVILYEFVVGRIPWTFQKSQNQLQAILQEIKTHPIEFPGDLQISGNMKDLIKGCLVIDETKRYDWEQIYLHPIFGEKYKINFENKKEGYGKIAFIMSNLRMNIHSKNINMTKVFNKIGVEKLNRGDFFSLIKLLHKEMPEEDINVIYQNIVTKESLVFLVDFEEFLKKYGCRMTGIDLSKMETESSYPEAERRKGFILIARLKAKIETGNLDIYKLFKSKDQQSKNELSIEKFHELICSVDKDLTKSEVQNLFDEFDINKDGKISFDEFYKGICKIAEIVPMEEE